MQQDRARGAVSSFAAVTPSFVSSALPTIVSHGIRGAHDFGVKGSTSSLQLQGMRKGSAVHQQVYSRFSLNITPRRKPATSSTPETPSRYGRQRLFEFSSSHDEGLLVKSAGDSADQGKPDSQSDAAGAPPSLPLNRPVFWSKKLRSAFSGKRGDALVDVLEAMLQMMVTNEENRKKSDRNLNRKLDVCVMGAIAAYVYEKKLVPDGDAAIVAAKSLLQAVSTLFHHI
eukprot:tig00000194_g14830.t1